MPNARRIDDIRPAVPLVRPRALAHLAPYTPATPKRPASPITHIQRTAASPQTPIVHDGTLRPVQPSPHQAQRPAARTFDVRPPAPSTPAMHASKTPMPAAEPAARPPLATSRTVKPKQPAGWRRVGEVVQYPLFAAIALVAANNTSLGQWFVLGYAVYAVLRRVNSQLSFGIALFLLVAIPLFQLLGQAGISQNIAVYVYELLVVGTVQAVLELYLSRHHKRRGVIQ